jgi:FAD-dependent oxidoreductase domain-containing protein 1
MMVGSDSGNGSGIMKADSLGRIAAGRYSGLDEVELGHGGCSKVTDISLKNRAVPREDLVISK